LQSTGKNGLPGEMLEGIKKDIEKLIALYEAEKAERTRLQSELLKSKADNETCRKQIEELEQQVNNLQLSEAFRAGGDTAASKEKIDKLIREIDKCISLLEN
jgi:septal ring factor EnvC (AmiA/AmiB activator)